MCKHNLRTMAKPLWVSVIAACEMIYWLILAGCIFSWYYNLDTLEMFNERCRTIGFATPIEIQTVHKEFAKDLHDWEYGFYAHATMALIFVPLAGFLFLGLHRKSRLLIVSWMFLSTGNALGRIFVFIFYSRAYFWLRWWEIYWLARLYFLLSAGHYCLDLWAEHADAHFLEIPLLIQVDDVRSRRLEQDTYRNDPSVLDERPRIIGYGQHSHSRRHIDPRYVPDPYPTWFQSVDEEGHPTLVLDNPAYEVDRRVGRMNL